MALLGRPRAASIRTAGLACHTPRADERAASRTHDVARLAGAVEGAAIVGRTLGGILAWPTRLRWAVADAEHAEDVTAKRGAVAELADCDGARRLTRFLVGIAPEAEATAVLNHRRIARVALLQTGNAMARAAGRLRLPTSQLRLAPPVQFARPAQGGGREADERRTCAGPERAADEGGALIVRAANVTRLLLRLANCGGGVAKRVSGAEGRPLVAMLAGRHHARHGADEVLLIASQTLRAETRPARLARCAVLFAPTGRRAVEITPAGHRQLRAEAAGARFSFSGCDDANTAGADLRLRASQPRGTRPGYRPPVVAHAASAPHSSFDGPASRPATAGAEE